MAGTSRASPTRQEERASGAVRADVSSSSSSSSSSSCSSSSSSSSSPSSEGAAAWWRACTRSLEHEDMPAVKREHADGEDMTLAAFHRQSGYAAPLNAAALPVVTPHPPPYERVLAQQRAYLGLHDAAAAAAAAHAAAAAAAAALHRPHAEDLVLERFSSVPDFQPFFDSGEPCIEVECGENKALLYISKLCQGSKGPSIKYRGEWLTPNEFQFVSGRETAKDWKRSIRHKGEECDPPLFQCRV